MIKLSNRSIAVDTKNDLKKVRRLKIEIWLYYFNFKFIFLAK